ncbi:MAG: ankyrin repeat domain-containing protein, partial [Pseudomonadota bacterium]
MSKPVTPRWRLLSKSNLEHLKNRAKQLRKNYRGADPNAVALFHDFHPDAPKNEDVKLSDAQLVLARAHDFPSWPKLKKGVALFNALCDDDAQSVQDLIRKHPRLLHEPVNGVSSNWGPPLACSAQLGSRHVFDALLRIDDQDFDWALDRAILKGRTTMAKQLMARGTLPKPGAVMGPCESLNVAGIKFLREIGVPLTDKKGDPLAPVALLLEGYARAPEAKHACLKAFRESGITFPNTPMMAFHLGDLKSLQQHLARDPGVLSRRYSYREIYPLELGCHLDETLGLHGTPIGNTTLLHMAMDFDEYPIAQWALEHSAEVNARGLPDADGFGDHTPLHNLVVSQAYLCGRQRDQKMANLLFEHGCSTIVQASIRKSIRFIQDESIHEYHQVTPLAYGQQFHEPRWANRELIAKLAV